MMAEMDERSLFLVCVGGVIAALAPSDAMVDAPFATPDIIEIHMGMPLADAVTILKAHNPSFQLTFRYGDNAPTDDGRGANAVSAHAEGMKDGSYVRETIDLKGTWAPQHGGVLPFS
jgi:hypothetical protein